MAMLGDNFSQGLGLIEKQGCSKDSLELVCIEVPKVFDQCLIKRCLKFKEGPDTQCTDEELRSDPLNNPKIFLCCRDFNIKLVSYDKIPTKGECGYKKVVVNFIISFYADFLDDCGKHCSEFFEINRTEVICKLYCPDPIAKIATNYVCNSEEAETEILKLELVAECLDGCFTKDCNGHDVLDVTLGFHLIVKCELIVQLVVPTFGYCPVPKQCKECKIEDPCKVFNKTPAPKFYPDQELKPLFPIDDDDDDDDDCDCH